MHRIGELQRWLLTAGAGPRGDIFAARTVTLSFLFYGSRPHEYLMRRRIVRARLLLLESRALCGARREKNKSTYRRNEDNDEFRD
ncbi:hypothetical protein [Burkholderia anthina]|uniref:hypothetical protein n=1 Tax=Burkholderia anthina TaxID=179879 RepID=UPI0012D93C12|nr:hypothetical protein [Burkholderia anthina]